MVRRCSLNANGWLVKVNISYLCKNTRSECELRNSAECKTKAKELLERLGVINSRKAQDS